MAQAETKQFAVNVVGDDKISFGSADVETLVAVLRHADAYRRRFTYHSDSTEWADSLINERDADECREVFVACLGTSLAAKPVAMVELVHDGSSTLTIALLVVAKSARLSGVGRRVVDCLVRSIGGSNKFNTLGIGVELENQAALSFWERLGFAETSTIANGRIVTMERWVREAQVSNSPQNPSL